MKSSYVLLLLAIMTHSSPAQDVKGFVHTNGANIYFDAAGSGPPVVLIHGGWLNSQQWDAQMRLLAPHYRVVRYDQRGYGRSTLGDSAYANHEDLTALLQHLGIARADIVGVSQGAQTAIDFAIMHPEMVRSLFLGDSPLTGFDIDSAFTRGMHEVIEAGVSDDLERLREKIWHFPPFAVAAGMPDVRARLEELIVHEDTWSQNRPGAPKSRRVQPSPAARLGEIHVPTLVIVGDGEMPALRAEAAFVAQHIAGARMVVVRHAGHFPNLENPKQFNALLLKWLAR